MPKKQRKKNQTTIIIKQQQKQQQRKNDIQIQSVYFRIVYGCICAARDRPYGLPHITHVVANTHVCCWQAISYRKRPGIGKTPTTPYAHTYQHHTMPIFE